MALRNIRLKGDPILKKTAREVEQVDDRIRMILHDMLETMRDANGVGLAAPQIGILRRMFVAEPEPDQIYYMINPRILKTEGIQEGDEGCLSVPDYLGTVKRPEQVKIEALDQKGIKRTYEFEGFEAVIMCHELDHLDGILYTDKASDVFLANQESEDFLANQEEKESSK